jgi:hypothetical protein
MFIVESSLPVTARFALATTAVTTSGISTALVAWCGSPYVVTLRKVKEDDGETEVLEMTTMTLLLRKLVTHVYDTEFLVDSKRPLAKWELAEEIETRDDKAGGIPGQEETVAETMDASGNVVGRWVVKWKDERKGTCHGIGKIVR